MPRYEYFMQSWLNYSDKKYFYEQTSLGELEKNNVETIYTISFCVIYKKIKTKSFNKPKVITYSIKI